MEEEAGGGVLAAFIARRVKHSSHCPPNRSFSGAAILTLISLESNSNGDYLSPFQCRNLVWRAASRSAQSGRRHLSNGFWRALSGGGGERVKNVIWDVGVRGAEKRVMDARLAGVLQAAGKQCPATLIGEPFVDD